MIASHEVEHDVFEGWLECLWVNQIEVHLVVGGHLDPFVALNEVDEASHVNLVVLLPLFGNILVLVLLLDDLEEYYLTGRPSNECLVVEQVHLSKVHVGHLLELHLLGIIAVDGEGLSLSVERVDHVLVRIVETLVWEVL